MDIDKILLAKEYANIPFILLNTVFFEKKPTNQKITYQTTHSAFIFPVSGQTGSHVRAAGERRSGRGNYLYEYYNERASGDRYLLSPDAGAHQDHHG